MLIELLLSEQNLKMRDEQCTKIGLQLFSL